MSGFHIMNDTVYAFIGFLGWLCLAMEERKQDRLRYFLASFIAFLLGVYFVLRLIGAIVFLVES